MIHDDNEAREMNQYEDWLTDRFEIYAEAAQDHEAAHFPLAADADRLDPRLFKDPLVELGLRKQDDTPRHPGDWMSGEDRLWM